MYCMKLSSQHKEWWCREAAMKFISTGGTYFTVFVQEMKSLWTGFGVQFVPGGEIILKIHLQIAILCTTLYQ